MNNPFVKRILQSFCRHRFSWPHTGIHGQYYQVCLICGSAYEYDWAAMRRTRRLSDSPDGLQGSMPGRTAESQG